MTPSNATTRTPSTENFVTKIKFILQATHFLPCVAMTLLTTMLAFLAGQRGQLYLLVPTVLLGQFPVGWINDYLDLENDKAAGRKDKPLAMGSIKPKTVLTLACISLALSIVLGYMYNPVAGLVNIFALTSALLYDFKLKSTVFSVAAYIVSFSLLPVFVSLGLDNSKFPGLWIVIAFAFLGTGVHFLNVIPDFIDDAKTGVKGFVHYFSTPTALYLSANFMILSTFIVGYRLRDITPVINAVAGILDIVLLAALTSNMYKKDYTKAYRVSNVLTLIAVIMILISAKYTQLF